MSKEPKMESAQAEAHRVDREAREAEQKRMYERAQTTPLRGNVPDARKGYQRFVVGDDCITPDGKHHKPGEVVELKKKGKHEPSVGWCLFEDHVSQQKES